jgi:pimeloyl-ACP methyl ester carboxylesterase
VSFQQLLYETADRDVQFLLYTLAMGDSDSRSQSTTSKASTTSRVSTTTSRSSNSPIAAIKYAHQAEKLSHLAPGPDGSNTGAAAVRAEWITPQDPIIVTADGGRLPTVPLAEAAKLNELREDIGLDGEEAILDPQEEKYAKEEIDNAKDETLGSEHSESAIPRDKSTIQRSGEGSLRSAQAPSRTNPLFPPLPLYGSPSTLRDIQCMAFRVSSSILSLAFLAVIVLGAGFTSIPLMFKHIWLRLTFRNPDKRRPFHEEEERRKRVRKEAENAWKKKRSRRNSETQADDNEGEAGENDGFIPTEGGPDPLKCDPAYYARRVGLDLEEFKVQTEDGFIIRLWHVYDPRQFTPLTEAEREIRGPDLFTGVGPSRPRRNGSRKPKYPVLMIHGLLQSAGAYCTNDDSSFAFYLCKSGYDVWLGNNRCGFNPEHTLLKYSDPRMWAWNIRQMGVMDLPALVSRVLSETGFEKLGLICHSQGTTETFVALAKEQRPDLGEKISVFCALAPAAYAGPLIGKMYFKFMRVITPAMFRLMFGIHAFIPFMMTMHATLPGKLYGALGYRVFSFLFNWTDDRWEVALRDRMFRFAPVYVSSESMRWWLGRECFAKQKCILATREEGKQEDAEDEMEDYYHKGKFDNLEYPEKGPSTKGRSSSEVAQDMARHPHHEKPGKLPSLKTTGRRTSEVAAKHNKRPRGSTAWYDKHCPPFAFWICGSDDLVDGRRLLRRFERGREPHVKVVHCKIIEEYEHLDVIWAIDAVEKVGKEVKEVLWRTAGDARDKCRVPRGCKDVKKWKPGDRATGGATGGRKQAGDGDEDDGDDDGDDGGSSSSDEREQVVGTDRNC